jgi:phosphinothricin acetyltransferase
MPDAILRPARPADVPGILAIYNEIIVSSTAVYALEPTTLAERQAWFDAKQAQGMPLLVAEDAQGVAGFSTLGDFRGYWPGYRYSVEHGVHVRRDARGRGLGTALVEALVPLARAMDKHVMIGGIDADNEASLRMHEKMGFKRVARFEQVGHKFGRWLDLVFVQRYLDAPGAPRG